MALLRPSGEIVGGVRAIVIPEKPEKPVQFPETTTQKERSEAYAEVRRIRELHRASEQNAVWAATRTALRFRDSGTRELGTDVGLLHSLAQQFQIHEEHHKLFVDVVQCLCKKLPVVKEEQHAELMHAYRLLEYQSVSKGE